MCPTGSRFGILYGLAKAYKPCINGSPPFRPILSAIGTPTYNLAKFVIPHLAPLTSNKYSVKNSFVFAEEIGKQNTNLFMASLDVESLFTNIPSEETVKICCDDLYKDCDVIDKLSKDDFRKLLYIATNQSYFCFDKTYYKQIDGVAMGSPLGPSLANAFLCHYERIWLDNCPMEFKPVFYRRYADDVFALFSSPEHVQLFKNYLNSQHVNISFTFEVEHNETRRVLTSSVP